MAENDSKEKDVDGQNLAENEAGNHVIHSKHPDVDRGWAWLVAIGMAMFYFSLGGFFRSFGVVFAAVVEQFEQSASLTSLLPGVRALCLIVVGPAATILSQRLTERIVIMAGAITVTSGFVLSYFATSLQFLIFSIGMLPGIGTSLIVGPSNVMMGRYFNRRRARAITVTSSVGCLGQIVVPLIMVKLIETYSVQGALLIFGGVILHSLLTGVIMKPINLSSIKADKSESENELGDRSLTGEDSFEIISTDEVMKNNCRSSKRSSDAEINDVTVDKDVATSINILNEGEKELLHAVTETRRNASDELAKGTEMKPLTIRDLEEVSDETDQEMEWKTVSKANTKILETNNYELEPLTRKAESAHVCDVDSLAVVSARRQGDTVSERSCFGALKRFIREMYPLELLLNVEYSLVLAASMLSLAMLVCQQNYLFVMCKSLGFSKDQSAMFLSIFGGADMIGRLSAGQLSDRKVLQPQYVMAIACFLSGAAFSFVPLAASIYVILPLVVLIGGFINVCLILTMPVLVEIIGLEAFPKAFAMLLAFHGIVASVAPPLYGLIKDFSGRYDAMFPLTGGLQICAGLLLVLECFLRYRAKKEKTSQGNTP